MSSKQLKGGVALSYVTIFLTNVIGLLITPFIVKSLGEAQYGIYTMIGALVGYMTVLDFGLNNTIIRFIAKYRAENDKGGEENFLAHAFIMYVIISLLVVIGGMIIYYNLDDLYGKTLTSNELEMAKTMFLILVFNLAISLPGGAFKGICSGHEEFILPRITNIIRYIVRSALVVGLLLLDGDAIGLVVLDTIMNLLIIAVNMVIVFKKLKVRIHLHQFEKKLLRQILGFSLWIFVFAIVQQMRWKFGHLILGTLFKPEVVAVYAIGTVLGNYYGAFSSAIASVFLPKAMKMVTNNASSSQLTGMFIKISRMILFVLLYILGGFILVGVDFIHFWVGDEFSEAYAMAVVMMLGLTLILSQGFGNNIIEARNKLKFRGVIMIIVTICGAVLGAFLAKENKGLGMIIGTVIFMLLERVIMTWYYHTKIDLQMFRYYKEISPLFLVSLIIITVTNYFSQYLPIHSVKYMILKTIVYSLLYITLVKFILTDSEKKLVNELTLKVKKKIYKK
ncbi:MAG: oligosaccharide flippase family protein [Flavobacteriaceae bacterium]|nr:oligosaccharide flippase family protein [Flavobacteriaceae bacterium]